MEAQKITAAQHDYTVPGIAEILLIGKSVVYDLIKSGQLESYKVSQRGTRVTQKQLDRFRDNGGVK